MSDRTSLYLTRLLIRCHSLPAPMQVGVHTVEGLINLIARERQGEQVDRARLKSLLRMFNNMVSLAKK